VRIRGQLFQAELLGHIVVAAQGEPGDLVVLGVPGSQEDDRQPATVPAQPPDHLEAVRVGQHHVEHDQVERPFPGQPECLGAGVRGGDLEAEEGERRGYRLAQERLVVDDQQAAVIGGRCRFRFSHEGLLASGQEITETLSPAVTCV
jgi:hypothetical protein